MRIALIDADGNVVNVIEATPPYRAPAGLTARVDTRDEAEPGGRWDGQFRPPPDPGVRPDRLASLEARIAALEAKLP